MLYTLENEALKLTVSSVGAEKHSLYGKKSKTEFLWNGDPAYWDGRAPVLFPIVGRLVNGTYRIGGAEYRLDGHGFAKDSEFTASITGASEIYFLLTADEATAAVYPYNFKFGIRYVLERNKLTVAYEIENRGTVEMPYAVGAHPGFMCPMNEGEVFTDYYLEFSEPETTELLPVGDDGFFVRQTKPFLKNERIIDLNYKLFVPDALVFRGLKSDSVTLRSKNHGKHVAVNFKGFEYLGIWTRPGAPYVCIEPWTSLGDYTGFAGEFTDRPGVKTLAPGEMFKISHTITAVE